MRETESSGLVDTMESIVACMVWLVSRHFRVRVEMIEGKEDEKHGPGGPRQ